MEYKITAESCAEHLSGVVQFPTISNELEENMDFEVFYRMHDYLEKAYPNVHATLEKEIIGKAHLLYHWKGTGKAKALPLLFMAHQDVVPEGDHSQWKYPPYSGAIAEGQVWGRGASDCKSKMISLLETVEHLIGEGFQPDYDIYLSFGYNEEVSGGNSEPSARLCANTLMERGIRIGCALDEGSGLRDGRKSGVDAVLCAISVAEKGYADFEIYRLDPGGHSARPRKDRALDYVAKAILAISENQYPYRVTEPVRRRYEAMAPLMNNTAPELSELLSDVRGNWDKLLPVIDADPAMAAVFHTTMVATMAHGSDQANILPEKASVTVNCRLLEGDTLESVRAHIQSVIPEGMEIRLIKGNDPSPASSIDTDIARLIYDISCEQVDDTVVLMPDITDGGTDAKYMYDVCECVYRFTGFSLKLPGETNIHAVNETMGIDTLMRSTDFYIKLMKRYGK